MIARLFKSRLSGKLHKQEQQKEHTISFLDFSIAPGRIDLTCIASDRNTEDHLWFELDEDVVPPNDAIAYTLATLCGQFYSNITMQLPISQQAAENLGKFTHSHIEATIASNATDRVVRTVTPNKGIALNFSGGLDSLAALCILPASTPLLSIDFGGRFKREREFFEQFHPLILRTNFRELGYDHKSWTFMGAASMLYAEYLGLAYQVFGTIFEASPSHFSINPIGARRFTQEPFCFAGLNEARYTNGITEVGTALIAMRDMPELIPSSLCSLDDPGSEKRFRKELLVNVLAEKHHLSISASSSGDPTVEPSVFGTNLADDFLCFYLCKYAGTERTSKLISDIPPEVVSYANEHDLNFYERLNPTFIDGGFPSCDSRARYLGALADAGILPYSEQDYREMAEVRNLLRRFHKNMPDQ